MRKIYRNILKHFFYIKLIHTRAALGLTQSEMAEILSMDDRSYTDLDYGKICCSAVTLALFLVYVCDDACGFLEDLRHAFKDDINQAV